MRFKTVVTTLIGMGLMALSVPAIAQQTQNYIVVSSCGAPTYPVGSIRYATIDTNGKVCGNITFGATTTVIINTASTGTVTVGLPTGSFTDLSGNMRAGGTSQTAVASNAARKRIIIQNPCTATSQGIAVAENLVINFTSEASLTAGNSFELQPCWTYDSGPGPVTTELITVNATTTSHKYVAKEQ